MNRQTLGYDIHTKTNQEKFFSAALLGSGLEKPFFAAKGVIFNMSEQSDDLGEITPSGKRVSSRYNITGVLY